MTSPQKTAFDAEMLLAVKSGELTRPRGAQVEGIGEKDRLGGDEVLGERHGNLKIVVRPGQEEAARNWVKDQGGEVISLGPEVIVADVPVSKTQGLESEEFVRRVEAPRLLYRCLDEARGTATGLDSSLETHSLTGEGVVVGVIDSGVDWSHPDFRVPDSMDQTRMEYFLHAHRPDGSQVSRFEGYGRDEINAGLASPEAMPVGDPHGHGTHCASIAVGTGAASKGRFRGVAPKATLMAVRSEPLLDTHIIRGIREIFARAEGRPAVVNLSLGGHLGPHDGTSAVENVIAQESGPGRIVVVAAGNEGDGSTHWSGKLVEGNDLTIPFVVTDRDLQWVDVWIPRGDEVDVEIESPDGVAHEANGEVVKTVFGEHRATFVEDPVNRDQNLALLLAARSNGHKWHVRLKPRRVLHGEVHAWTGTRGGSRHAMFPTGNNAFTVGMPATEERAISVASFVSKTTLGTREDSTEARALSRGQISPFSSWGPTRYGQMKPDIAGPGQYVTAGLASGSKMAVDPNYAQRVDRTGKYITIQGTSMATPFVAGVVALLLEREPGLTPEDIQQRLRITARRDEDTGQVWNASFGHGKIDVGALLEYGERELRRRRT